MNAAVLALLIGAAASPSPAQSAAVCPDEQLRVVAKTDIVLPATAHPSHDRVRILVDLGSDGRVRRSALVESSGDATIDDASASALAQYRFAPPAQACVAVSSVWSQVWAVPPELLAATAPAPAATAAPATTPAPATTAAPGTTAAPPACAAPFVRPYRLPAPRRRQAPGTVAIDVSLDATARVTGVRLAGSSGHPKTDYAATTAARNGTYVFESQPNCAAAATTHRLEMTFR